MAELVSLTKILYRNNNCLTCSYQAFESLCKAWEEGEYFWHGDDEFGEQIMISLKKVVGIFQQSGESRQKFIEDSNETKKLKESII